MNNTPPTVNKDVLYNSEHQITKDKSFYNSIKVATTLIMYLRSGSTNDHQVIVGERKSNSPSGLQVVVCTLTTTQDYRREKRSNYSGCNHLRYAHHLLSKIQFSVKS